MPQIVNWEILANPLNWIIVALMLAIAVFGLSLIAGGGAGSIGATGSTGL
jgi:hypothetical protein